MYLEPYVWQRSDVKLQCSFCSYTIEIGKGEPIPKKLESFINRGLRYLSCPKCLNGFLKLYIKTKTGKWRFKARTLYTEAVKWKRKDERNGESQTLVRKQLQAIKSYLSRKH